MTWVLRTVLSTNDALLLSSAVRVIRALPAGRTARCWRGHCRNEVQGEISWPAPYPSFQRHPPWRFGSSSF